MRYSQLMAPIGLAMALIAVSACGGDEGAGDDGGADGAPQTLELTAKEFSFIPDKLRVEEGRTVEVRFKNSGGVPHTFTLDEFDVDAELSPGEEQVVLVATPARAGQYSYYCRFHRAQGMEGTITITGEGGAEPSPGSATPAETTGGYRGY